MDLSPDCPRNARRRLFGIFILLIVGMLTLPRIQSQEPAMSDSSQPAVQAPAPAWIHTTNQKLEAELVKKYGEGQRVRIQRGLQQVSEFWRPEDGDAATYEEFINTNFAGDQPPWTRCSTALNIYWKSFPDICMRSTGSFASRWTLILGQCFPLIRHLPGMIRRHTCWMIFFRISWRLRCF